MATYGHIQGDWQCAAQAEANGERGALLPILLANISSRLSSLSARISTGQWSLKTDQIDLILSSLEKIKSALPFALQLCIHRLVIPSCAFPFPSPAPRSPSSLLVNCYFKYTHFLAYTREQKQYDDFSLAFFTLLSPLQFQNLFFISLLHSLISSFPLLRQLNVLIL